MKNLKGIDITVIEFKRLVIESVDRKIRKYGLRYKQGDFEIWWI